MLHVRAADARARSTPERVQALSPTAIDASSWQRAVAGARARLGASRYAVGCNSITGALALGYDARLRDSSCAPTRRSPVLRRPPRRGPMPTCTCGCRCCSPRADAAAAEGDDHGAASRPIAASACAAAAGQRVLRRRRPTPRAACARALFPPAGLFGIAGVDVHVERPVRSRTRTRVLIYETGLAARRQARHASSGCRARWPITSTSIGGATRRAAAQMSSAGDWITSGATASYGTVSEPCTPPAEVLASAGAAAELRAGRRRSRPTGRASPGHSRACSSASRWRRRSRGADGSPPRHASAMTGACPWRYQW